MSSESLDRMPIERIVDGNDNVAGAEFIPLRLFTFSCLYALKQGTFALHEAFFGDIDRAAVAALHRLLRYPKISGT